MALGDITRGTTNANRLRRCDRWLASWPGLRQLEPLHVVDLGFGHRLTTTLEMASRLSVVRADLTVWGIEIDPERVARAQRDLEHLRPGMPDVRVIFGGFEIPLPDGIRPGVIRAFNVLRQYDEGEVARAWQAMTGRLAPGGLLIDGTCDEIGRVSTWVSLTPDGPQSLTVSLRLSDLDEPSIAAERLPKALIHHNVAGERIHDYLRALDHAWSSHASLATFGPVQRWLATVDTVRAQGWPVRDGRSRWRLGEITVDWASVAPGP